MNETTQPDLIPMDRTTTTLTVRGSDLDRAERQLRDIGAVLLAVSVKGSTYTIKISLPPGATIEQAPSRGQR
jgi:hypothetical protein